MEFESTNKRVLPSLMKTLQIKLLPLPAAKQFTLRSISHIK